jgi:adenosylhomocysteinase
MENFDIHSIALAEEGRRRIAWAFSEMPVLQRLFQRFSKDRPLTGVRIGACLHVTTETANLLRVLQAGGAEIALCASNPLSTQDDVAAALVQDYGIPVYAICGEDNDTYYRHIHAVLDTQPQITMDDGADLISELHKSRQDLIPQMLGGTEETTTGVIRLRAMAKEGALGYPVIAVNDAMTKHLFDNRYGTGQSTLDGIIRATNILLAGRIFTVVGYGWCGRGIAMRARGHGAHVIVIEVDPLRALEATMDGYQVMPIMEAAPLSDFVVTATGDKHVVDKQHLEVMKDGSVLANSGHFNVEVNIPALQALSREVRKPRPHVEEYLLHDGRRLRLLAEGRLVNLAAAEGHPAAVMDMSFANQALALAHMVSQPQALETKVHTMPRELDDEVAQLKLAAMGVEIDSLSEEQQHYLSSWQEGT